ncbi:hypothetical protein WJX73_001753 [Symbiochloris irregularis]|uniref:Uncharacterized protein n=1 Tax=Symbiochloris irregularis TaxID=706552 RepID=A0AAW1PDT1_9CHLO
MAFTTSPTPSIVQPAFRRSNCTPKGHSERTCLARSGRQSRSEGVRAKSSTSGGSGGGSAAGGGSGGGGGGQGSSGWGPLGLWAAYLGLLERQPVFTKAWSAGLLNGLGDICSQKLIEHRERIDWKRLGIFTGLGAVFVGPILHFWYLKLSTTVTAGGVQGTLIRLGLDQLIFAPIFIAGFQALLLTVSGERHQIKGKLERDLKEIVITNWKIWIPFQFFNFGVVPQRLQVLASNTAAVGWNTYLSHASHK